MVDNFDLTVFVVTYNHEDFIIRCLNSIVSQKSRYRTKIIIVDDASTDQTSALCKHFSEQHSENVEYICNPKNKGVYFSIYPFLCNRIETEFWSILDGDDYWCDDEKVQIALDTLRANPDCVAFAHQTQFLKRKDVFEIYNFYDVINEISKNNNRISYIKNKALILPHTSSRIYRNIIDFKKHSPYASFDVVLFAIYLEKGNVYFYNKVMSVYYAVFHNSLWRDQLYMDRKKKYLQLRKQAVIIAQYSKKTNWKYDDVLSLYIRKKVVSSNHLKSWLTYIDNLKKEEIVGLSSDDKLMICTYRPMRYRFVNLAAKIMGISCPYQETENFSFTSSLLIGKKIVITDKSYRIKILNFLAKCLKIEKPYKISTKLKDKKILAIYGAGGFGREVYDIAIRCNAVLKRWCEIIFIDDFKEEGIFYETKAIHFESLLENKEKYEVIIAIGEPSSREKLFQKLSEADVKIATLIDPKALVSPTAQIGEGTIICEFASIHCNVFIGMNCVIQPYCDVGHDIHVGNHCVFSPHFAPGGNSVFGDRVYAGMHSSSKEGLTIGNDVIFAMGAAVFRDVDDGSVVVGNPARITRGNDEGKVFK